MANTITVTTNANNFTIQYNGIIHDYAFNDVNFFLNVTQNRFVEITQRSQDERRYKFDTVDDTIDVNGETSFANAGVLAASLRAAIFEGEGVVPPIESLSYGGAVSEDNVLETTVTGVGVYAQVSCVFTLDPNTQDFVLVGTNRIQYTGQSKTRVSAIVAVISGSKQGSGQENYKAAIFKNATQLSAGFRVSFSQNDSFSLTLVTSTILQTNDIFDMYVQGIEDDDDVTADTVAIEIFP